jgi:protein-disulfide isomerase
MPAPGDVAAVVGDRTITIADVDREWQAGDPGGYVAVMRQLHTARRQVADRMATAAVVAREAAARGMSAEALLAEEVPRRVVPLPDTALSALYESLGGRTRGAAFERMRPSLRAWVERKTEPELAKMTYVEELVKTSTRLEMRLAAPVVEVERSGLDPARGPASAPVEIVAFGDLQSPDYARLAQVVGRVSDTFGARVRFTFKLLPAFGPQSVSAAEAGACAHAQGRFWPFHDIAARPGTLDARRLKAIPAEAGLDQALFDRCLSAGTFRERVRQAAAEARRYGIDTGPALLVNGRLAPAPPPFLPPFEYFTRLIEEELQRQALAGRKGAP